jgi:hypothetical protein
MKRLLMTVVLLVGGSALASAQSPAPTTNALELLKAPAILTVTSEKVLNVPAFGFFGPAQSDQEGAVFIHPAPFQEVNILKISPSSDTVAYKVTDAEAQNVSYYDYGVTPGGTVWALVSVLGSPELRAIQFGSDGEMKDPVSLQAPPDVQVNRFLALETGTLLASGFYTEKAVEKLRGHPFLGIFDSSGKLLRDLGEGLSPVDLAKVGKGPRRGGCVAGDDGNAYFLDENEILVVSPGGEIAKRVPFKPPSPDLTTDGLYVSKGQAAIRLTRVHSDHRIEVNFLVMDLTTGRALGWYAPPTGAGYSDVGFSPDEGFTFFANEQGKIKLVKAALR